MDLFFFFSSCYLSKGLALVFSKVLLGFIGRIPEGKHVPHFCMFRVHTTVPLATDDSRAKPETVVH